MKELILNLTNAGFIITFKNADPGDGIGERLCIHLFRKKSDNSGANVIMHPVDEKELHETLLGVYGDFMNTFEGKTVDEL